MTKSRRHRLRWPGALALTLVASTVGSSAIELDVNAIKIEAGMRIARGQQSARFAFHRPYRFSAADLSVEQVEVITEFRRLVMLAEERIANGDHMFEQGGRMVDDALRPWRRRVSVVARVGFSPQNAYVTSPPLDIALTGASGEVPRLDLRNDQLFAQSGGAPNQSTHLVGVAAEATFDAAAIGQTIQTAIVRLGGEERARVTIDFSRLD